MEAANKKDFRVSAGGVLTKSIFIGQGGAVIPETVEGVRVTATAIGKEAFRDCKVLTSITISNSVTSIGQSAFYGTPWYTGQPDGVVYINNVLYKYKGEMLDNTGMPYGKERFL